MRKHGDTIDISVPTVFDKRKRIKTLWYEGFDYPDGELSAVSGGVWTYRQGEQNAMVSNSSLFGGAYDAVGNNSYYTAIIPNPPDANKPIIVEYSVTLKSLLQQVGQDDFNVGAQIYVDPFCVFNDSFFILQSITNIVGVNSTIKLRKLVEISYKRGGVSDSNFPVLETLIVNGPFLEIKYDIKIVCANQRMSYYVNNVLVYVIEPLIDIPDDQTDDFLLRIGRGTASSENVANLDHILIRGFEK